MVGCNICFEEFQENETRLMKCMDCGDRAICLKCVNFNIDENSVWWKRWLLHSPITDDQELQHRCLICRKSCILDDSFHGYLTDVNGQIDYVASYERMCSLFNYFKDNLSNVEKNKLLTDLFIKLSFFGARYGYKKLADLIGNLDYNDTLDIIESGTDSILEESEELNVFCSGAIHNGGIDALKRISETLLVLQTEKIEGISMMKFLLGQEELNEKQSCSLAILLLKLGQNPLAYVKEIDFCTFVRMVNGVYNTSSIVELMNELPPMRLVKGPGFLDAVCRLLCLPEEVYRAFEIEENQASIKNAKRLFDNLDPEHFFRFNLVANEKDILFYKWVKNSYGANEDYIRDYFTSINAQ